MGREISLAALAALSLAGCPRREAPGPAVATTAADAGPPRSRGGAALAALAGKLLAGCEVSHEGHLSRCPQQQQDQRALRHLELRFGMRVTAAAYCGFLAGEDRLLAAFAARRFQSLFQSADLLEAAAEPATFACLRRELTRAREPWLRRLLARTVCWMGTALGRDDEVLRIGRALQPFEERAACLTTVPIGEPAPALARVERVLAQGVEPDLERQLVAALLSQHQWRREGTEALCGFTRRALARRPTLSEERGVLLYLARRCPGGDAEAVRAVEQAHRAGRLTREQVTGLTYAMESERGTLEQRARAVALLRAILASPTAAHEARAGALWGIARLDRPLAVSLARRYHGDPSPLVVREAGQLVPLPAEAPPPPATNDGAAADAATGARE